MRRVIKRIDTELRQENKVRDNERNQGKTHGEWILAVESKSKYSKDKEDSSQGPPGVDWWWLPGSLLSRPGEALSSSAGDSAVISDVLPNVLT